MTGLSSRLRVVGHGPVPDGEIGQIITVEMSFTNQRTYPVYVSGDLVYTAEYGDAYLFAWDGTDQVLEPRDVKLKPGTTTIRQRFLDIEAAATSAKLKWKGWGVAPKADWIGIGESGDCKAVSSDWYC